MKSILWIDDDESFVSLVRRKLEEAGFSGTFQVASNGEDAMASLSPDDPSSLPDYIFLDINMPVKNGFEFLQDFNRKRLNTVKRVVITMVTSSLDKQDVKRSKELGADYYLVKPVSADDLRTILMRH